MRSYRIAAIPGDGIGKEVIAAGLEVLTALERRDGGFHLEVQNFPWGSDYFRAHGKLMPEDGVATLRKFDAIFFGAVGDPQIPDHVTLWGLRLPICQGLDQYANVRPTRLLPGIQGRCATLARPISTGSSCARIPRANMPAMAAACIAACRRRSPPRPRSSPASASSASCASPSTSRPSVRARSSPWSPSRTPSATAW